MAVHLAVACAVFGGVLFCAVLFPTRCLGWHFSYLLLFNYTSCFHNVVYQRHRDMIPKNFFSSIFSVCDTTYMICSREHNCTENEKTELISYFIFPAKRFTYDRGNFALIILLRNVTSNCIELSRIRISRCQLVPKIQNWKINPGLFKLFC